MTGHIYIGHSQCKNIFYFPYSSFLIVYSESITFSLKTLKMGGKVNLHDPEVGEIGPVLFIRSNNVAVRGK